MRTRIEQYFLDNRTYPATCVAATATPAATQISLPGKPKFFSYACSSMSATTYTITATDTFSPMHRTSSTPSMRQNVRKTTRGACGLAHARHTCWVSRKSGDC